MILCVPGNVNSPIVLFKYTSFVHPGTILKMDFSGPDIAAHVYYSTVVPGLDPEAFEAFQDFAISKYVLVSAFREKVSRCFRPCYSWRWLRFVVLVGLLSLVRTCAPLTRSVTRYCVCMLFVGMAPVFRCSTSVPRVPRLTRHPNRASCTATAGSTSAWARTTRRHDSCCCRS